MKPLTQIFSRKNHESNDEEEEASTFTCKICTEEKLPTATKKFKNNKRCVHSICTDCIANYIKVNIEERNPAKIKCPSLFCGQMLDPLSCTQIIPAQLFDKWCDVLCDSTVLRLDTCYCPYRDCSALIVNECGGDVRRSKCPSCKRLFCFRCKQPWHPGYGCEDHQGASIIDIEFEVLEKRNEWKRCPTCKHCVELYEGCSVVHCRCRTAFCYKCGRQLKFPHWCKGNGRDCYLIFGMLLVAILYSLFISSLAYAMSGEIAYLYIFFPVSSFLPFFSTVHAIWLFSRARIN